MAKLNFVKAAQKDIYKRGKYVTYKSERGKRAGQNKTKLDRTVPADDKDEIYIKKGESYYWWQFKNGGKNISKDRPKNSQLTQSAFKQAVYEFEERISEFSPTEADEVASFVEELKSDMETLKDETEEKLNNMPEGLQQGSTGELLQERIDALDNTISELDGIDCDYEEPTLQEWIDDEGKEEKDEDGNDWEDSDDNTEFTEWKQEKLQEWLDEKTEELSGITIDA